MAIRVLEAEVAGRIAAGEVVERPSSVVKELLENSLDAVATRIDITTTAGGTESIIVSDNGVGIPEVDVPLVFQQFATSKIRRAEDLNSINTLGFRGEAMYSISAVSEVELITRSRTDSVGVNIRISEGKVTAISPSAANVGTKVSVHNIFTNFPARKKFLRSPKAEAGRISTLVKRYSMIWPDVSFSLSQVGTRYFSTTGSGSFRDVISAVYGVDTANGMISIEKHVIDPEYRGPILGGIIGLPSQTRANRSHINIFVNGRYIQNRTLSYAFEQAYHGLVGQRRYPIGVLDLRLSGEEVDVNVHPAKTEVRFLKESEVFGVVHSTVRDALLSSSPVQAISSRPVGNIATLDQTKQKNDFTAWQVRLGSDSRYRSNMNRGLNAKNSLTDIAPAESISNEASSTSMMGLNVGSTLPMLRILGQAQKTYIIAEGPDGIYLIDQHAAHERVVFEEVVEKAKNSSPSFQKLLDPFVINLDSSQISLIEDNSLLFDALGMELEQFGPETYLVRTVPAVLTKSDPAKSLIEILDSLEEGAVFETWEEKAAYSVACHGAIRAGQSLSVLEMEKLIRQLESCKQPNTCPHGRHTLIHLSSKYLELEFGRT